MQELYFNQKGSAAKMTDIEYAVTIYCAALKEESDLGDAYLQGVLNTLATLPEKQQTALRLRFREGKSYNQVGQLMGVSGACSRQMVLKALHNLQTKRRGMCVSYILETCSGLQKRLAEQKAAYGKLYEQLGKLFRGEPIDEALQKRLERQQMKINGLDLPGRVTNALARMGIEDCDALLSVSCDELKKIHCIGAMSIYQITCKMYELGFTEWAEEVRKKLFD